MIKFGVEELEEKDCLFIRACVLKFISDTSLMIKKQDPKEKLGINAYSSVRDVAYNILQIIDGSTSKIRELSDTCDLYTKMICIRNTRLTDAYVTILHRILTMPLIARLDDEDASAAPGYTSNQTIGACARLLRLSLYAD